MPVLQLHLRCISIEECSTLSRRMIKLYAVLSPYMSRSWSCPCWRLGLIKGSDNGATQHAGMSLAKSLHTWLSRIEAQLCRALVLAR